jgi:hypothetical protein
MIWIWSSLIPVLAIPQKASLLNHKTKHLYFYVLYLCKSFPRPFPNTSMMISHDEVGPVHVCVNSQWWNHYPWLCYHLRVQITQIPPEAGDHQSPPQSRWPIPSQQVSISSTWLSNMWTAKISFMITTHNTDATSRHMLKTSRQLSRFHLLLRRGVGVFESL